MSDLDKLKNILFGHEKKALDAITRRLDTPESRAADVADVLPDAINRSYTRDPRLKASLRQPLEESLSDAIRRDPQRFADALFPVMGPAIRRSIREALKSLVQSMNQAIDTSLSPTARYRAWREGMPLGEWALRKSLVYRVDEVYLIDPVSGLLIEHVRHGDASLKDEDAVSAMLTAIQDFVRDSFSGADGTLSSADIGDCTVWVAHGPRAMLAAVIRGTPPRALREVLDSTIERVHLNYGRALQYADGAPIPGLDADLESCLQYELRGDRGSAAGTGLSWPLRLLLLALLAGLLYWAFSEWQNRREVRAFEAAIVASPGIVLTGLERRGGQIVARGLRDPLAVDVAGLAAAAGIDQENLRLDFHPFQSLEPELLLRRSRAVLKAPDSVALRLDDGALVATGSAGADWVTQAGALAPALAGIERVDFSAVLPDDAALLARLRAALAPPADVTLEVSDGKLTVAGSAPQGWINSVPERVANVAGLRELSVQGLTATERDVVRTLVAQIDGNEFFFPYLDSLSAGETARLVELAARARALAGPAAALGLQPNIVLTGYTDGIGGPEQNLVVQLRRANALRQELVRLGVDESWLQARGRGEADSSDGKDLARRKVRVDVFLTDANGNRWQ